MNPGAERRGPNVTVVSQPQARRAGWRVGRAARSWSSWTPGTTWTGRAAQLCQGDVISLLDAWTGGRGPCQDWLMATVNRLRQGTYNGRRSAVYNGVYLQRTPSPTALNEAREWSRRLVRRRQRRVLRGMFSPRGAHGDPAVAKHAQVPPARRVRLLSPLLWPNNIHDWSGLHASIKYFIDS
jgi:hypothetical protein